MSLTDKQKKDYLDAGGNQCPYCGGDITAGSLQVTHGIARQARTCDDCDKMWIDIHHLIDVEEEEECVDIEEGDYVTEDHVHFYTAGESYCWPLKLQRPHFTVPDGEDMATAVMAHMDRVRYWPNVWFISDHGNIEQLSLGTNGQ